MLSTIARPAGAVDCSKLSNAVYVTGTLAAKPLVATVGRLLAAQNPSVTVIYFPLESCAAIDAFMNATPAFSVMNSFSTWNPSGVETGCNVTLGAIPDVAISDVFLTTCVSAPGGMPPSVGDFLGPIQTMTFVVPKSSTERSISAEAAYNIFGFGAISGVPPWTDEHWLFRRTDQAGAQRLVGAAIGVKPALWKGSVTSSDTDTLARVIGTGTGGQTLGILPVDVAQSHRGTVSVLAYQHFDQTCGYYPDRDATSNDKINVRDGHYPIWGPLHLFARVGASGSSVNALAGQVIDYITGTKAAPSSIDWIATEAQSHLVPRCAMRVNRSQELGPLSSFAPTGSCGCYFEKVANGASTCKVCVSSSDCPATTPVCSHGYCESQ